jgi:hypothetical protein
VRQVLLAVFGVHIVQVGDTAVGEPVKQPGHLAEPAAAAFQMQRGAQRPGQRDDVVVPGNEQGEHQLFGDQPPSRIGNGGEVQAPDGGLLRSGQAGHSGEVPHLVFEHRVHGAAGELEAGSGADVGAAER